MHRKANEAGWPKNFLNILIEIGFILRRQVNSCSCPFLEKIQAIFNNLFFPLSPKKVFTFDGLFELYQKVIFMIIRAIPLGKIHYHSKHQNEGNRREKNKKAVERKRWEMKKKSIKRGIGSCFLYNKAYSVIGPSSEAN